MEQIVLNAIKRDERRKSACKALRAEGYVPAVVYGERKDSVPLKVSGKDLKAVLHTGAGRNVILTLKIDGAERDPERTVLIKELQYHPVRADIIHVDFNSISLTETIRVEVPVEIKGESKGVRDGGILEHVMWQVEIECLPTQVPDKIEIDVSAMEMGDTLLVKELPLPEGLKVLTDPELIVLSVAVPKAAEVAEEEVSDEDSAREPEVITQKKASDEDAEEGEEKSK